jgi:four helix bundle protein
LPDDYVGLLIAPGFVGGDFSSRMRSGVMKRENVLVQKSFEFARRTINAGKFLRNQKAEYILSKQLVRSGTSIGANVEEAIGAHSRADFYAKLTIAYKEAREASYWIRLLGASNYLSPRQTSSLSRDVDELMKILGSIQLAIKKKEKLAPNS